MARSTQSGDGGMYYEPPTPLEFFSSGCAVLDQVLGGGWPLGRISNIVGDRSTGKTLLAIEGCANFAQAFPSGAIQYNEVEAAFDIPYAQALGLPVERINFTPGCFTTEDLYNDLQAFVSRVKTEKVPGLYILDSLDALSHKKELEGEFAAASYGTGKAKQMGELFRRLVQLVANQKVHVMVISQERDNIGVTFGATSTRSGGRALDFYASHILWLAQVGKLKRTVKGVERIYGIEIRAQCKKNKVGPAYRECEFPIHFGFGIEDVVASVEFLTEIKCELPGFTPDELEKVKKSLAKMPNDEYKAWRFALRDAVTAEWARIEDSFKPTRTKYE